MPDVPIMAGVKGLNLIIPRHMLPEGSLPLTDNMNIFQGSISVAPGYNRFDGHTLNGAEIMLIDEFPLENGITHLLAFTNTKIYRYNTGTSNWVDITNPTPYTGGLDDFWSTDIIVNPAGDLLFIATNYLKDPVQKWDGNTAGTFVDLTGSTTDAGKHFSASIAAFQNHLVHLNRTEAGIALPRKLRWSDNGVPESYTIGGSSEAGFLTLFQGADHGVLLQPLGNFLAAYRERSIHLVSYVGAPFWLAQRQVINGVGLVAPRALLNLDTRHVFLGNDNVYIFNGVDIEPIGEQIRTELFDTVDPVNISRSIILLDEPRAHMQLIVPSQFNNGIPDTWWNWDLVTNEWSGPVKNRLCTGGGTFERQTGMSWDGAVGRTWDSFVGTWNSVTRVEGFPVLLFGNQSMLVYQRDPTVITADGASVNGRMELKSISAAQALQRRDAICVELVPLGIETGADQVRWYVGVSENPIGPFQFFGPYLRGVRGTVKTSKVRGKWHTIAAEADIVTQLNGVVAKFEPASGP